MQHWLVKQEPEEYSWDQLERDGSTDWTGVRNHQAARNLKGMRKGDLVLFYHSVGPKEIVGLAKVSKEAFPDPSEDGEGWVCVSLTPVKRLANPLHLSVIKEDPLLKELPLVRQSRLSVMPIPADAFDHILHLTGTNK
jgi:predicted RNA-binding protein with PUA-like domain